MTTPPQQQHVPREKYHSERESERDKNRNTISLPLPLYVSVYCRVNDVPQAEVYIDV
jgi:hypothetical protein